MKRCSKCGDEKPLDEFPLRKDSKDGRRGVCSICKNAHHRDYIISWKQKNPNKCAEYSKKHREANLESHRLYDREYAKNNREKKTKAFREWRQKNPDKVRASNKRHYKKQREWLMNHPELTATHAAKRRHLEMQSVPPWVGKEHLSKIKEIYKAAKVASAFHEEPYHVDHIEPLKGVNENNEHVSCGLHVFWNLQVLHYKENLNKKNKLYYNQQN